jgi:head-tail adaptor
LVDELTPAEEADLFARRASIDMYLLIDDLQTVPGIPDYHTPTASELGTVQRTRAAMFLLDGREKVKAEKESGQTVSRFRVNFQAEVTPEELAFFKARTRTWKEGGDASWAELVNVVAILEPIHIVNNPNIFVNQHGGPRVTGQSEADGENNLINALAKGLGKRPKTIKQWRNDGMHLNAQTRSQLAEALLSRSFFEDIRKPKADIILKAQGRNEPPEAITNLVSEFVQNLLAEYQTNGGKFERETIKHAVDQFTQTHFPEESRATLSPASDETVEQDQEPHTDMPPQPTTGTGETGDTGGPEEDGEAHAPDKESEGLKSEDDLQPPEGSPDQQLHSKTDDKGGSEGLEKSSDKPRQAKKILSALETKKDQLVRFLSDFALEATAISDYAGLKHLALKLLPRLYRLCSRLLSHEDFKNVIKQLKANARG